MFNVSHLDSAIKSGRGVTNPKIIEVGLEKVIREDDDELKVSEIDDEHMF